MKVLNELTLEHKDALKFVLEQVNPNDTKIHITVKDLRQIDKICRLLEVDGERVELEDADFNYLKNKFDNYSGWNPQARAIVISVSDKLEKANG